jgi:hypothetical protein
MAYVSMAITSGKNSIRIENEDTADKEKKGQKEIVMHLAKNLLEHKKK